MHNICIFSVLVSHLTMSISGAAGDLSCCHYTETSICLLSLCTGLTKNFINVTFSNTVSTSSDAYQHPPQTRASLLHCLLIYFCVLKQICPAAADISLAVKLDSLAMVFQPSGDTTRSVETRSHNYGSAQVVSAVESSNVAVSDVVMSESRYVTSQCSISMFLSVCAMCEVDITCPQFCQSAASVSSPQNCEREKCVSKLVQLIKISIRFTVQSRSSQSSN